MVSPSPKPTRARPERSQASDRDQGNGGAAGCSRRTQGVPFLAPRATRAAQGRAAGGSDRTNRFRNEHARRLQHVPATGGSSRPPPSAPCGGGRAGPSDARARTRANCVPARGAAEPASPGPGARPHHESQRVSSGDDSSLARRLGDIGVPTPSNTEPALERVSMESSRIVFTPDEVERARRYHRPLYIVLLVDTTFGLVALSLLAFTRVGSWLYDVVDELPWWGRAFLFPILVLGTLTLLRLPLSFWRGHLRERRWGFSTQTAGGWLLDRRRASRSRLC